MKAGVQATERIRDPGFVVVGASLAGLRAVEAARRADYRGRITLIGAEPHLPYDRPPLSKAFLTDDVEVTFYRSEERLRGDLDVDLRLGLRARTLDPAARAVDTDTGPVGYERLLIATGAQARTLAHLPALPGVWTLRTLDDALAVRSELKAAADVVVVGAGFIGAEIASSARAHGARVTIIEAAPVPLVRAVGEVVGRTLAEIHGRHGSRLLCDTAVGGLLGEDRVRGVRLSSGEVLPADLVVVGVGAVPATQWLVTSGIALDPRDGGVVCDEYMESSISGVYAAGDVAHWPNALFETSMRLENWTNAAAQAAQAAVNALVPEQRRPYETVPYFWSDWYDQRIQFVGTANADSVSFASGGPEEDRFVALYRRGERLVGAAALNEPRKIMKYRRLIAERGPWSDAGAPALTAPPPRLICPV